MGAPVDEPPDKEHTNSGPGEGAKGRREKDFGVHQDVMVDQDVMLDHSSP